MNMQKLMDIFNSVYKSIIYKPPTYEEILEEFILNFDEVVKKFYIIIYEIEISKQINLKEIDFYELEEPVRYRKNYIRRIYYDDRESAWKYLICYYIDIYIKILKNLNKRTYIKEIVVKFDRKDGKHYESLGWSTKRVSVTNKLEVYEKYYECLHCKYITPEESEIRFHIKSLKHRRYLTKHEKEKDNIDKYIITKEKNNNNNEEEEQDNNEEEENDPLIKKIQ